MSPGPGGYPYMAQPQQPWGQAAAAGPGSPTMMPPNVSPRPGTMQMSRPDGAAGFYAPTPLPQAPAASGASAFGMNAGARMFEPQKSKALRIVNPETHTEIDLAQLKKASAESKSSASAASNSSSSAHSSQTNTSKAAGSNISNESRVKTQNDFQQKVLRLKMEKEAEARKACLLYTSPSPRDGLLSRMPSSA